MLRPVTAEDFGTAARLLAEGFPERGETFWASALDRLGAFGGNAEAGVPFGQFLIAAGAPAGILLTPAGLRPAPGGGTRRLVNLSSWYVRAEQRWRAPMMLKAMTSDPDTVYVDLTPTPQVRRMIEVLGMVPVNRGVIVRPTAVAALAPARGAQARVLPPGAAPPAGAPGGDLLDRHRALGCLPVVLSDETGEGLAVFRRSRVRGLPAAEIVYADSHRRIARALGPLSRLLLGRGFAILLTECRSEAEAASRLFRPRNVWFAKGDAFEDRTDHLGTEVCLFGL